MIYTGERAFACAICDNTFKIQQYPKSHEVSTHMRNHLPASYVASHSKFNNITKAINISTELPNICLFKKHVFHDKTLM